MTAFSFKAAFNGYVQQTQKTWEHNRTESLGASEAFACLRQSFFKKWGEELGFQKDPDNEDSWGAMKRGDLIENHWVVPALLGNLPEGVDLLFAGDAQETFIYGKNSATPDGLFVNCSKDFLAEYGIEDIESDCVGLEIKSIDPRVDLEEEKAVHHGQAQQQMGILRSMTKWKPTYTIVLYVDASFLDNIKVFPVKFDEAAWRAARQRAKRLFSADTPADLPAEGKVTGGCSLCSFKSECALVTMGTIPENENQKHIEQDTIQEFRDLVMEERKLASLVSEHEEDLKAVRAQIKQKLADNDTRRMVADDFKVSWSFQKGRTTYDYKAMEADGINLEPYKKEGAGFDKLVVTLPK